MRNSISCRKAKTLSRIKSGAPPAWAHAHPAAAYISCQVGLCATHFELFTKWAAWIITTINKAHYDYSSDHLKRCICHPRTIYHKRHKTMDWSLQQPWLAPSEPLPIPAIIHSLFSLWSGVLSTKYVCSRAVQELASTSDKWMPRRRRELTKSLVRRYWYPFGLREIEAQNASLILCWSMVASWSILVAHKVVLSERRINIGSGYQFMSFP